MFSYSLWGLVASPVSYVKALQGGVRKNIVFICIFVYCNFLKIFLVMKNKTTTKTMGLFQIVSSRGKGVGNATLPAPTPV